MKQCKSLGSPRLPKAVMWCYLQAYHKISQQMASIKHIGSNTLVQSLPLSVLLRVSAHPLDWPNVPYLLAMKSLLG